MGDYQKGQDRVKVQEVMNSVWDWLYLRCLKESWVWATAGRLDWRQRLEDQSVGGNTNQQCGWHFFSPTPRAEQVSEIMCLCICLSSGERRLSLRLWGASPFKERKGDWKELSEYQEVGKTMYRDPRWRKGRSAVSNAAEMTNRMWTEVVWCWGGYWHPWRKKFLGGRRGGGQITVCKAKNGRGHGT